MTTNECQPYVDALTEAGLEEFASEIDPGIGAGKDPSDPCSGAESAEHSHTFSEDGKFASYDGGGKKVDFGKYEITDEGTFTLSRPPFETEVDYTVDGDTATFQVVPTECADSDKECRFGAALAIATFYPGTYERAK